jgi:hypothetical protein
MQLMVLLALMAKRFLLCRPQLAPGNYKVGWNSLQLCPPRHAQLANFIPRNRLSATLLPQIAEP